MTNARDKANIPVLNFQSKGIDDNADATAITINSSEQVGIGTTSPANTLDVNDSGGAVVKITRDSQSSYLQLSTDGSSGQIFSGAGDLKFKTGTSEKMRITSAGNVGIGTTSPTVPLEVYGAVKFNESPGASSGNVIIDGSATGNPQLRYYQNGTAKGYLTYWDSTDTLALTDGSANGLHFKPSNGRVGIGTSNPGATLETIGTAGNNFKYATSGTYFSILPEAPNGNVSLRFRANSGSAPDLIFKNDSASEVVRIANSGNVGIGTSSPTAMLELFKAGTTQIKNAYSSTKYSLFGRTGGNYYWSAYEGGANLIFSTSASDNATTERMRISSNGAVGINSTATTLPLGDARLVIQGGSTSEYFGVDQYGVATSERGVTGLQYAMEFRNPNGLVGRITTENSATSYNTSSDYRLKENVNYDFDATTRLKQLKPARFNFIANADKTVDGFIAHEVSTVVPEAISGKKDAINKDGTPDYQGIDQSKLVPLLVKTIQELEARITTLEANNP